MLLQNYQLDLGFIYYLAPYQCRQSVVIETISNQDSLVVLQSLLPVLYGQVVNNQNDFPCPITKGLTTRKVEIELQNNTKYVFDIPFSSSNDLLYDSFINELDNPAIKSWNIQGEIIKSYLVNTLLLKVP